MQLEVGVLVSMCGLSVDGGIDGATTVPIQEDVQKYEFAVLLLLHDKLNARIHTVKVLVEGVY